MLSTSQTQPAHVPPLARCNAAHRRVSLGNSGCRHSLGCGGRAASTCAATAGSSAASPVPTKSIEPVSAWGSIDRDDVAVSQLLQRATRERFGSDVSDAGARRDAREARVGEHGHVFAPGHVSERARELIGLFHAGPEGTASDQHQHVTRLHRRLALAFAGAASAIRIHDDRARIDPA